jgi:hypothetical protein
MIILQNVRTPSLTRSFGTPMRSPVYDGLSCGVFIAPCAPLRPRPGCAIQTAGNVVECLLVALSGHSSRDNRVAISNVRFCG